MHAAARRLALGFLVALAAACGVRPPLHQWGAREGETTRALPGDALIGDVRFESTRAVDIDAPPRLVYPWLVQIGLGRGGFYSYDLLEQLAGLDVKSADRIDPALQRLAVGDEIRFMADGGPSVYALERDRYLLLYAFVDNDTQADLPGTAPTPAHYFQWSWLFYLEPQPGGTRLIVRSRYGYDPSTANEIGWRYVTQQLHFIMERRMLLGVKARAERLAASERRRRAK